ncbi:MAG: metallophosphoesterase [Planctomycetaceae bacterium]
MYDIIGDIHGHADELVELLHKLNYSETSGGFRHSHRTAVFCGDFIDRGPQIPDVVRIVRSMVQNNAALAVMGNHEFNALAYHTPDPASPHTFLRPHTEKNNHQHAETTRQFTASELHDALAWFRTLPVALDLDQLRIVHACWHPDYIRVINAACEQHGEFSGEFLKRALVKHSDLFSAIECVLKGPELPLPDGITVTDKEGNLRKRIRIRWFDSPKQQTWATYALPVKTQLPDRPVPQSAPAAPYPADAKPVFVGHYWLPDDSPTPLKPNVACLDYSVARHGMLCAYRFDGETTLSRDRFVTVNSRDRGDVV